MLSPKKQMRIGFRGSEVAGMHSVQHADVEGDNTAFHEKVRMVHK
jgi:hypothetical protein